MIFTIEHIANVLGGRIEGDRTAEISDISPIDKGKKGTLSFLHNEKYLPYIYKTVSTAVVVRDDFIPQKKISCTLIKVENPHLAFSKVLESYQEYIQPSPKEGIDLSATIDDSVSYGDGFYLGAFSYISKGVSIGKNVKIAPQCFIGENVSIGDNVQVHSGVRIGYNCKIGNHCRIDYNVVIGSDGFGFAPNNKGSFTKIPQIGNVIVHDNVDIGSCCTIDRATFGSTVIQKGVKLDNQIHIAHNVQIGENTVIAAQTGIAGSTHIGKNCMIGGQVGFVGHISIGDNVSVQAQSGVTKNVKNGERYQGSPAFDYNQYSRSYVLFKKLPQIIKDTSN